MTFYDFTDYQQDAARTESPHGDLTTYRLAAVGLDVLDAFLYLGDILGPKLDKIKRYVYYGADAPPLSNTTPYIIERLRNLEPEDQKRACRVIHAMIGIITEVGELAEAAVLPLLSDEVAEPDNVNIHEEIGDILWYVSLLAEASGGNLQEIAETNITKLRKRYPDKFSSENALNRDLEGERKLLEASHVAPPLGMEGCC